jgi:hypothetical protein
VRLSKQPLIGVGFEQFPKGNSLMNVLFDTEVVVSVILSMWCLSDADRTGTAKYKIKTLNFQ